MRAQSSGEWPGVRRTLRLGLFGFEECVGGSARPEELEVDAIGLRLGIGPRARWAELAAGNCGMRPAGGRLLLGAGETGEAPIRGGGRRGGGIMEPDEAEGRGGGGIMDAT
jgi:hypothetical protein